MVPRLNAVSFGGYRPLPSGDAALYHTGSASAKQVEVDVQEPNRETIERYKLTQNINKQGWTLAKSIPAGSAYRFLVDGTPRLDTVTLTPVNNETFNQIDKDLSRLNASGTMLDVFQHSLKTTTHRSPGNLAVGRTTHFNQKSEAANNGLQNMITQLPAGSVQTIMLKPFTEGGYWTINPYKLCPKSFQNEAAFDQFLGELLKRNQTLTMDLALLNQNMEGGHYRANLIHGARSPFNAWFIDNRAERSLESPLARVHSEGFTHGILPTKRDPVSGQRTAIDFDRFEVGFSNAPDTAHYNPLQQTFIQIIPTLNPNDDSIHGPEDSAHSYSFPVDPKLVRQKLETAKQSQLVPGSEAYKRLMLHWPASTGSRPPQKMSAQSFDDAFGKWNGNVDVALLDPENPEVRAYLSGAITHWVRRVITHHRGALSEALPSVLTPETLKKFEETRFASLNKPPLSPQVLSKALSGTNIPTNLMPEVPFAQTLIDETPLSALPLPNEWLTATSLSDFQKALRASQPASWRQQEGFQHALKHKLSQAMATLPAHEREKLSEPLVQSQLASKMGAALFLQLLTGACDPQDAETRLFQSLPKVLLTSDPTLIARLLPAELTRRLNALPEKTLKTLIAEPLKALDPAKLRVADAFIQHYGLGPNVRLDAAKDVTEFDDVYGADTLETREKALYQAVSRATDFWQELLAPAKKLFPKMTVLAELTDVAKLSGPFPSLAEKAYQQFYTVFDSNPDMDHVFGPAYQSFHYASRPFEFGDDQRLPYQGEAAKPNSGENKYGLWEFIWQRSTKFPLHVQQQYQTMITSHDYSTATHNFLVNPLLFFADREPWRGILDDIHDSRMELSTKACFEPLRQKLASQGVKNPGDALYKLEQTLLKHHQNGTLTKNIRPRSSAFLSQTALNGESKSKANLVAATPTEAKAQLIELMALKITPKDLGLADEGAKTALIEIFKDFLTESSAAKAKRAILNNATLAFFSEGPSRAPSAWQKWAKTHQIDPLKGDALQAELFDRLVTLSQKEGEVFGYWPLDYTLDRWLNTLDSNLIGNHQAAFKQALFDATLNHAQIPQKLERITALQVALPGLPSVSINDLLGPGGGETDKNAMVQNRQPIDVTQPAVSDVQRHMRQSQLKLMQLRHSLPVLNDGLLINPALSVAQRDVLNDAGIMPIIRDNGTDQAIVLIHTGKPKPIKNEDNGWTERIGDLPTYKHPYATQAVAKNFKLDLSALDFPVGAGYQDVMTGDRLVINNKGQLVKADEQGQPTDHGLDIETVRVLKRL
ncbi:MAG: hypothetical protein VKK59_00055 [Vampirovibrionales bacterium]|nr:hypothetical protein [Vampirovibrionales bacterium]